MSGIAGGPTDGSGWFHDPAGSSNLRWWDGVAWTQHLLDPSTGIEPAAVAVALTTPGTVEPVAVATSVSETSQAPAAAPHGLTRRELREQEAAGIVISPAVAEPATSPPALSAAPASVPFADAVPVFETPTAVPPASAEPVDAGASPTFEQLMTASVSEASSPPLTESPSTPSANLFPPAAPGVSQHWSPAPPPPLEDLYSLRHEDPVYQPMERPRSNDSAQDISLGSTSTTAIWIYAILPLLHLAIAWFVYEQLKPADDTTIRWVVLAGPIVIYLILAAIDRSRLLAWSHTRVPSALFALIPPLYIGIRAARLGLGAVIPAVAWLVFQAAAIFALVVLFPTLSSQLLTASPVAPTPSMTPAAALVITDAQRAKDLTPEGMAARIIADFAATKVVFTSVTCPQIPSLFDGAQTVCVATLSGGTKNLNVSVTSTDPYSAFAVVGIGATIG